jgi:hypothetical protein
MQQVLRGDHRKGRWGILGYDTRQANVIILQLAISNGDDGVLGAYLNISRLKSSCIVDNQSLQQIKLIQS